MELKTSAFHACFSIEKNNFVSLVNLATGTEYIRQTPRDPLVEIYALTDGQKKKLTACQPQVNGDSEHLEICYTEFGGLDIRMTVHCHAAQDRLSIRAELENHSQADVVEILLPHIGGLYLGGGARPDYIIYPHHAGERSKNPVMAYGQNKKDFWRASSVAFEDIYRREINYCALPL